jgi:hypothetical protein
MSKQNGGEAKASSLFDYGLYLFSFCSIFFLKPWDLNMAQGMFFVFGVFALLGLSFICKKERDYQNKFIGLIILWSLMNVFIHTFQFSLGKSITASFINFCLLSEGFIYVLSACLLFYLVVSFTKNFNIVYPLIVMNILNLLLSLTQKTGQHLIWSNNHSISGMMGTCSQLTVFSAISVPILAHLNIFLALIPITCIFLSGSFTGMFALLIVGIIYSVYRKKWLNLFCLIVTSSLAFIFNYHLILKKFLVRMELWGIALKEIYKSPIFGNGFDNSVNFNMVYSKVNGGFTYRHNDFLNIARDLGIIFAGILIIGLFRIMKNSKIDYLWCSLIIIILCFFWQTNMYFARIGGIAIMILALKERQRIDA